MGRNRTRQNHSQDRFTGFAVQSVRLYRDQTDIASRSNDFGKSGEPAAFRLYSANPFNAALSKHMDPMVGADGIEPPTLSV